MKLRWLGSLALVAPLAGCAAGGRRPPPKTEPEAARRAPVALTLLYTSDEHGWVAPVRDAGKPRRVGAAALLSLWRSAEGHCVPSSSRCEESATIALSGGDNWTGPAISTFFKGEIAAITMRRLGYAAIALGNHELDFGRAVFARNAEAQGIPYLAANVSPTRSEGGVAEAFTLVRRRGVAVGVVGLSTRKSPSAGLRDNYKGLTYGDEEPALVRASIAAYAAGADVVVVVSHVCAEELEPIVLRHPELGLAFVGAGHCHRNEVRDAHGTPVVEPGSFLRGYVRIKLEVDIAAPARQKLTKPVIVEPVSLERAADAPEDAEDPALSAEVAAYAAKTKAALGEVLGYADASIEPDSAPLANLITDRWREVTKADVAILNRFATRQAIPKGPITLETVHSVLPFDNNLVVMKLRGADLVHNVQCCGGHVAGATEIDGEVLLDGGKKIDPNAIYKVVSTDYAYAGGSGFTFEKADPEGVVVEDWRAPLIRWLRAHPTNSEHPLGPMLDNRPRRPMKKRSDAH